MISSLAKSRAGRPLSIQLCCMALGDSVLATTRKYSSPPDKHARDDWDFLSSIKQNPAPSESSPAEGDLEFNADAGDLYAQPKPVISPPDAPDAPTSTPLRGSNTSSKVRFSKEDLSEVFKSPRQSKTSESAFSNLRATQQERMAFAKIFDSILQRVSGSSNSGASSSRLLEKSKGMSSGMQAIFEKGFAAKDQDDGLSKDGQSAADGEVRITNDDIRKYPMSMGPLFNTSKSSNANFSKIFELQTILKRKFQPIIRHINEDLLTDVEVSEFYRAKVLARFQQKKKDSSKSKGSGTGSLWAEHDLAELEELNVTVENFPVDYNTLPFLLKECMRVLADDFNSPMDAITLFEMTKRESIDAYVAGCNVWAYNEAIRIKWNGFQDLHFVESLVSEMRVNGILGNAETTEILGDISKSVVAIKSPDALSLGPLGQKGTALWSQADEERMTNINKYRLRVMESLIKENTVKQDSLLSGLLSR